MELRLLELGGLVSKQKYRAFLAMLPPCVLLACSDSTGPEDLAACTVDTGTVEVSVTAGTVPTFSWSPNCAVGMILVEQGASDVWGAATDDTLWDDPESANLVNPPVAYGSSPSGTTTLEGPLPLTSGTEYEVILWRIVPDSSAAVCLQRSGNACLMAVHPFIP